MKAKYMGKLVASLGSLLLLSSLSVMAAPQKGSLVWDYIYPEDVQENQTVQVGRKLQMRDYRGQLVSSVYVEAYGTGRVAVISQDVNMGTIFFNGGEATQLRGVTLNRKIGRGLKDMQVRILDRSLTINRVGLVFASMLNHDSRPPQIDDGGPGGRLGQCQRQLIEEKSQNSLCQGELTQLQIKHQELIDSSQADGDSIVMELFSDNACSYTHLVSDPMQVNRSNYIDGINFCLSLGEQVTSTIGSLKVNGLCSDIYNTSDVKTLCTKVLDGTYDNGIPSPSEFPYSIKAFKDDGSCNSSKKLSQAYALSGDYEYDRVQCQAFAQEVLAKGQNVWGIQDKSRCRDITDIPYNDTAKVEELCMKQAGHQ